GDVPGAEPVQLAERHLDHHLGLGARDQDPAVDHQVQRPEAPRAEHVLQRLALRPAGDHAVESGDPALGRRVGQHQWQVAAGPGGLGDDPAGVRLRMLDPSRAEPLDGLAEQLAPGDRPVRRGAHPPASASRRARSSVTSASLISSSSPAATRARWDTVRRTRWSDTRFPLKWWVRTFALRPPPPIWARFWPAASAACRSCSSCSSRDRSTVIAFARFCSWLFSSCIDTTSPVGRWVIRTAESVVLTDCPPGPEARHTSPCRSAGSTWTSTSSASGSPAPVAEQVCTRPCDSVTGTRCTRWGPASNFMRDQTPSPASRNVTS